MAARDLLIISLRHLAAAGMWFRRRTIKPDWIEEKTNEDILRPVVDTSRNLMMATISNESTSLL